MLAIFWWSQRKEERKIHWVSWAKMCESKNKGGLSFKDLRVFNMALLAKQGWRILQEDGSLLQKIYKAKYFPKAHYFYASIGTNPSYAWKGIWEAMNLLLKGGRWSIGNGKSVRIWKDYWVPGHPNPERESAYVEFASTEANVGELTD
ncbi:uncharacterized mitochondrial protein AtMg00310-like [Juglans microcarpa x Juglans regia]|uniref:uncharacterized mitochondrial protein AtMg00310-like n=1 Tax=Juglans microcarpa x Juglans regia TaxID=2249226 RepID=UPI001B7DE3DB|nr:uncharacterized mitochondrial protein AtMg00310-like [Juglans microcarpa x Juglans regia]